MDMNSDRVQQFTNAIGEHHFFRGMDKAHLHLLASCAEDKVYAGDAYLGRQGERAEHFFLIFHGRVALETGGIPVQAVDPDEILGWSWMVPPYRWRFDARAVEDTRTVALEAEALRALCDAHPDMGYELLRRLVQITTQRLEATRQQLVDNTRRARV